jgi:hypothetical protein
VRGRAEAYRKGYGCGVFSGLNSLRARRIQICYNGVMPTISVREYSELTGIHYRSVLYKIAQKGLDHKWTRLENGNFVIFVDDEGVPVPYGEAELVQDYAEGGDSEDVRQLRFMVSGLEFILENLKRMLTEKEKTR